MRIGIYGYGNLGRGVLSAAKQNPDVTVTGVFTRRAPGSLTVPDGVPVLPAASVRDHAPEIDVLILCGGSATDLPRMTPSLAEYMNVIDSFDTHAKIPAHFAEVDAAARKGGKLALISAGWDPGLFSLNRLYAAAVLPDGQDYTFWGKGVSQGHSDAIRRIPGVRDARQYTVPVGAALEAVLRGETPALTTRQKHRRECFVVAEEGADRERIAKEIRGMPYYFSDYDTDVTFITEEEMERDHKSLPHGGYVIRTGRTGFHGENRHTVSYQLTLDSNPEFTAGVLIAYARAIDRMARRGCTGCKTVFDIAPGDLSPLSPEELRAAML